MRSSFCGAGTAGGCEARGAAFDVGGGGGAVVASPATTSPAPPSPPPPPTPGSEGACSCADITSQRRRCQSKKSNKVQEKRSFALVPIRRQKKCFLSFLSLSLCLLFFSFSDFFFLSLFTFSLNEEEERKTVSFFSSLSFSIQNARSVWRNAPTGLAFERGRERQRELETSPPLPTMAPTPPKRGRGRPPKQQKGPWSMFFF